MSVFDPGSKVNVIFALLIFFAILLFSLLLLTGFVISGGKGVLAMATVCAIPGILSIAGYWPTQYFIFDRYVMGGNGAIGGGFAMLALTLPCMVMGWGIGIILIDLFPINDRFWHLFDHLWIAVALLAGAGIFFSADSEFKAHQDELDQSSRTVQRASSYLLSQIYAYEHWCQSNGQHNSASCTWASDIQNKLIDYSWYPPKLFVEFGPRTTSALYGYYGQQKTHEDIDQIRSEIAHYNDVACPIIHISEGVSQLARPSSQCQSPPAFFCTALPSQLKRGYDDTETLALASECIFSSLVTWRNNQEKLQLKVDEDKRAKYWRWVYYLFFSILIGLKIASSTDKFAGISKREKTQKRKALKAIFRLIRIFLSATLTVGRALANATHRLFLVLIRLIKGLKKSLTLPNRR